MILGKIFLLLFFCNWLNLNFQRFIPFYNDKAIINCQTKQIVICQNLFMLLRFLFYFKDVTKNRFFFKT